MRLAKATQTALDEMDRSCSGDEIHECFIPKARIVLGNLPCSCIDSVARVAVELAKNDSNGKIPTGYGSCCVRHFGKRSEQLERVSNKISIEHRFALIGLTSSASIHNRWTDSRQPRVAPAIHREYLRQVAQLADVSHREREQWRLIIEFVLDSLNSTPIIIRNVAYALVWCGYFSPDRFVTDEQLAEQFFADDRAEFNRFRQEGLRLLSMLLEFSGRPSMGGAS